MITNPHVSIANSGNISELVSLINKAYRGEGFKKGWTSETELFDGARINENILSEFFEDENAVILKYVAYDHTIVGCVYLQKQGTQAYLGLLSVLPDMQTAGVGKQLLAAAEEYAVNQHCNKIVLTVITIRDELVAWYKRRGYQQTGIKSFPQDKINVPNQQLELFVLEKNLKSNSR